MTTFSDKPWDQVSDMPHNTLENLCSACLIDMNEPGMPLILALAHFDDSE